MISWMPWHKDAARYLLDAKQADRLPHGLLLKAKEGAGGSEFVRWWSQILVCNQFDGQAACGQCKSCHLVQNQSHPDVHVVKVLEDKKQIGVDQIRLLIEQLRETPQQSGWRVAIIQPAELLTIAGFNALLKTLEEPGNDTQIMLLSHDIGRVPATVISRCQQVLLDVSERSSAYSWLAEQAPHHQECEYQLALELNHFAPVAALDWLQSSGPGELESLLTLLDAVIDNKRSFSSIAETFKTSPYGLLKHWYFIVCQLIKIKSAGNFTLDDNSKEYQLLAEKLDLQLLFKLHDELLAQRQQLQSGVSLNIEMQIDGLAAQWLRTRSGERRPSNQASR